jgi:predicted nucleotidyltransferase
MNDFIEHLTNKYKNIKSIWLFGSRANNNANENSDWDLMIFGDNQIFSSLQNDKDFNNNKFDLLVVTNSDNFASPYDASKKGSLANLEWKKISTDKAIYWAYNKDDFQNNGGGFALIKKNAIQVFPKN